MLEQCHLKSREYSPSFERITRFLILIFTLIIFATLDLFLKRFIFDFDPQNQGIGYSFGIIGIRSFPNPGSSLFNLLNISVSPVVLALIAIIFAVLLFVFSFVSKSKFLIFILAIMMAGLISNSVDWIQYGYVLDYLYTPWFDRGTFNLADFYIIFGIVLLVTIFFPIEIYYSFKNKKII